MVEIRCGLAELARREAEAAAARAAEASAEVEAQLQSLAALQAAAEPAAARVAKEEAHKAFKTAVAAARERTAVEDAAEKWLARINDVNSRTKSAHRQLRRERELADSLLARRDSLLTTAEAAKTMADAAMEACLAARRAVPGDGRASETGAADAAAEASASAPTPPAEGTAPPVMAVAAAPWATPAVAAPPAAPAPVPSSPFAPGPEVTAPAPPGAPAPPTAPAPAQPTPVPSGFPGISEAALSAPPPDRLVVDLRASHPQVVVRLLGRDRQALAWLVDRLAGADPSARRAWQFLLSNFVDAIVGAAIDDACFDFLPGNPFWDMFTPDQAREVARGLAALGYRYDGFGAFADGRVPDQRDLALAIGGAGMYPIRIRYWPKPAETGQLYSNVRVAVHVFVATRAPSMTLGQLVLALGRRAVPLTDLWNNWDRVRPMLMSSAGG